MSRLFIDVKDKNIKIPIKENINSNDYPYIDISANDIIDFSVIENARFATSRLNYQIISKLQLQLILNSRSVPLTIDYISEDTLKHSKKFLTLQELCQIEMGMLKKICHSNNSSSNNLICQLNDLKGLLDIGILSQEEFDQKKKELLNLK